MRAWPQLRIEHVEAEAAGQALGSALGFAGRAGRGGAGRATPQDVAVEVAYGRPDDADQILSPSYAVLTGGRLPAALRARGDQSPEPPSGVVRYSGEVPLDQPGPFDDTVRVLPNHPLLATRPSSAWSPIPGPGWDDNGDLR